MSEVASSEAKNRKVISLFADATHDAKSYTSYLGFMYGITGRLTTMNRLYLSRNPKEKTLGDVDLGLNYRFFSRDKKQFHFRMSAFGHLRIPMEKASDFPPLPPNNPFVDHEEFYHSDTVIFRHEITDHHRQDNWLPYGGIALTLLDKKLAVNFDVSYNHTIPKGDFRYGSFFKGGLSFGYLLIPKEYKSYNDVNLNVYVEPKYYYFAKNQLHGEKLKNSGGSKVEIAAGGQLVFLSSMIFEFGYVRSFADSSINIKKDIFFTAFRYLFF